MSEKKTGVFSEKLRFCKKAILKSKTTKNNIINSNKGNYFF